MDDKAAPRFEVFGKWERLYDVLSSAEQHHIARWRAVMTGVAIFVIFAVPLLLTVFHPVATA
jgi:hypothetical protein